MNASPAADLPPPLYDAILRRAPVNVFLFDSALVCRYAAPVGDEFLGRSRDALIGLPAAEVLPPAANGLRPVLERAAHEAASWHDPAYRFTHHLDDAERSCCWSIQVEPLAIEAYHGVLVSWSDAVEQMQQRAALEAEVQAWRREAHERNSALMALLSDLRNAVTPISGFLQVIARRPAMLGGASPADVIIRSVLPRIADLLEAADRLHRPPIYSDEETGATRPDESHA